MYVKSVSQCTETLLQMWGNDTFTCRYSYLRSKEAQELQESGQDFLSFKVTDSSFLFTVCDGVGMSFHGELASAFLGEKLIEWLHTVDQSKTEKDLEELLQEQLREWTIVGTDVVNAYELSEDMPWLFREVLDEKRKHGSESMFICGRVDILPTQEKARVLCIVHGDSYIQFLKDDKLVTSELQGQRNTGNRWSTRRGGIGEPLRICCKTVSINEINRIVVHSDGLPSLTHYDESKVKEEIERSQCSPASDDISYLDISW